MVQSYIDYFMIKSVKYSNFKISKKIGTSDHDSLEIYLSGQFNLIKDEKSIFN